MWVGAAAYPRGLTHDRIIGIIGGSGLARIDGLSDITWRRVESPFGPTSDEFCFGTLDGGGGFFFFFFFFGGRQPARGFRARRFRGCRSVCRPHLRS